MELMAWLFPGNAEREVSNPASGAGRLTAAANAASAASARSSERQAPLRRIHQPLTARHVLKKQFFFLRQICEEVSGIRRIIPEPLREGSGGPDPRFQR